jgi:hypothetical protein
MCYTENVLNPELTLEAKGNCEIIYHKNDFNLYSLHPALCDF